MPSKDVVRIKTGVQMSSVSGSTREYEVEIPRSEWEAMTPEDREKRLEEIADETLADMVTAWAFVVEEN